MRRVPHAETAILLSEINTTPLIDVLLVLLVMLIITIPLQTHAVKFDLPAGHTPPLPIDKANLLSIDADGTARWNGVPISRGELRQELAMVHQLSPAPELHLQPDSEARHGDVDEVLAIIKREQIARFGFVGNEKYLNVF
jgi:biopolymer transport protein ExbD